MRSWLAPLLCFALGVWVVTAFLPGKASKPTAPVVVAGEPDSRTQFRTQQRLSPDGTVPPNALMRAKEVRTRKIQGHALRAGVSPTSWTFLGPTNVGGRIRALAFDPTNPSTMWIGSCGGGIWKSTDAGTTWSPQDDFLPGLAVSSLVVDPTNPNIVYAATGEGFFETEEGTTNTACIRGAGIFKTTNGGATWDQIPFTSGSDFYYVNRLAMAPGNPSVLLAATSTGIWRSSNAGATWTKTLAGEWVYDVDFHPTNPSLAIAGTHENGVYRTTDGGLSWIHSPSIMGHRTEVAYAPSNPSIVYATVSDLDLIKVWRSTDGGATFAIQAGTGRGTYSAYNNALWVNPLTPSQVLFGGVYVYRSTNSGGSNAQAFSNVHADVHGFFTHPQYNGTTNTTLYAVTDGGLYRITNPTGTNSNVFFHPGMGITQFYGAAINPVSGRIMGGTQDNGTRLFTGDIGNWTQSAGGDGGYNATDPLDANYFYGNIYWALQFRSTNGGTNSGYIYNTANPITDSNNSDLCNFENHFILDPNDPNRLLVCTQRLWRTNNAKATQPDWFVIKPSIAPPQRSSKPSKVGGGNAHFAPNNPYNLSTVAVAPGNSNVIWVGHNNGQVYMTTNGTDVSPSWTRVDSNGPLPGRWVSRIAVDPFDSNHVYVAFMGWHEDSIWETHDGGLTWGDIASGRLIPASVNVIALHPTKPGWIYAGTDLGLFTTSDNGQTWSTTASGPGACSIEEITFRNPFSIVIATYGRGMFQADIDPSMDTLDVESATVRTGISPFGRTTSVLLSDNLKIGAGPDFSVDRSRLPVEVDVLARTSNSAPTSMNLTIEAGASAGGMLKTSLFNFELNAYVEVDLRPATPGDTTFIVSAPAPAHRFIGSTGEVRIRIGFTNPTGPRSWTGYLDRVSGTLGL